MLDHAAVVRAANQLQPLPPSVGRLTALVAQDVPDLMEITEVISFDPVLTGKLLQVANSALVSSHHRTATVKQAVIRLGAEKVLGLAVGACAKPLMGQVIPGYALTREELWRHSLAVALATEVAKPFCKTSWSSMAFTAALLHDIGKLIVGRFLTPELLGQLKRATTEGKLEHFQAELEVLSFHHGEIGGVIAQHWELPESIVRGIIYHHNPEEGQDTICYVIHLANAVAKRMEAGPENNPVEPESLAQTRDQLGITQDGFVQVCETVAQRLGEVSDWYN